MLGAVERGLRDWARRKEETVPFQFSWTFIVAVCVTSISIGAVATAQRPWDDWPKCLLANLVIVAPWLLFSFVDVAMKHGLAIGAAWITAAAILLFGTSTPVHGDFAPLLLAVTVDVVTALTSLRGGLLTAGIASAVLGVAVATDRMETPLLYFAFVGIGLLVGHLTRGQQKLLGEQRRAQAQLATHAAADERRRIAREVHDVIAHSLSITLLHVTAARHALQDDDGVEIAVTALQHAEQSGRHAMTDIRHTVGLLDGGTTSRVPEPGIADIDSLAEDFIAAGLNVTLQRRGEPDHVSAAAGLALYRVAQESLSNIAKHAPTASATILLDVTDSEAELTVLNQLSAVPVPTPSTGAGRGLIGMRQRVEAIGGTFDVGAGPDAWRVQARIPLARSHLPGADAAAVTAT